MKGMAHSTGQWRQTESGHPWATKMMSYAPRFNENVGCSTDRETPHGPHTSSETATAPSKAPFSDPPGAILDQGNILLLERCLTGISHPARYGTPKLAAWKMSIMPVPKTIDQYVI